MLKSNIEKPILLTKKKIELNALYTCQKDSKY